MLLLLLRRYLLGTQSASTDMLVEFISEVWQCIIHADVIESVRGGNHVIMLGVSGVPKVTESRCGTRGYRGDLRRYLGRDNYHRFFIFIVFLLISGSTRLAASKLFLDEVEVEDDTVENDLGDIGKDQPQIEYPVTRPLVIQVHYIFYGHIVQHSHTQQYKHQNELKLDIQSHILPLVLVTDQESELALNGHKDYYKAQEHCEGETQQDPKRDVSIMNIF